MPKSKHRVVNSRSKINKTVTATQYNAAMSRIAKKYKSLPVHEILIKMLDYAAGHDIRDLRIANKGEKQ